MFSSSRVYDTVYALLIAISSLHVTLQVADWEMKLDLAAQARTQVPPEGDSRKSAPLPRGKMGDPFHTFLTSIAPPNNSLEPTWPARILELRSILVLGWPGGSARGR